MSIRSWRGCTRRRCPARRSRPPRCSARSRRWRPPPAAFTLPAGAPADAATAAGVTAALREILACLNTGNALAVLPLTTDRFVRALLRKEPITAPEEAAAERAGPPPTETPAEWSSLLAVWQVRVLPDGRVGALVARRDADPPPPRLKVGFFVFARADGRYLLDEVTDDLEGLYPPPGAPLGTPAP